MELDLLILGSGIAGLTAANRAAARGYKTAVLTKSELNQSATQFAQGGVAAALAPGDSVDLHFADTVTAGAGLCDPSAVRILVEEGPLRVRELIAMGANFDRENDATLSLGREGGHSKNRVVHAGGDATGAEIERALVESVRQTVVSVYEKWHVVDLIIERGSCVGAYAMDPLGELHEIRATHTLMSTGGAGQLYSMTTNPTVSTGDGFAMAMRAGAFCADMEFVQFHPTALAVSQLPRPLLTEALRGQGAILRDSRLNHFMADVHPLADLAPRDVVARAISAVMREQGVAHVWLDATQVANLSEDFPSLIQTARQFGIDPTRELLPVAPAAHYMSGGVVTDLDGATTIPGLWACGEVACSGVHGANRLASNSLLDGLVFAARAIEAISSGKTSAEPKGVMGLCAEAPTPVGPICLRQRDDPRGHELSKLRNEFQEAMSKNAGVLRDERGLAEMGLTISEMAVKVAESTLTPAAVELRNLLTVGGALVGAAELRRESRGNHNRAEYPDPSESFLGRYFVTATTTPFLVPLEQMEPSDEGF